MNLRKTFYFLGSLVLTSGVVLAQTAQTPDAPPAPPTPEAFGLLGNGPGSLSVFFAGGSFIGVHAEDISKENMARYNMREARGVGITEVVKDSPAEKAGLRKDDVILKFENDTITSVRKLTRLVSEVAPDQTVRLTISRSGGEQEVAVTVAKRDHSKNTFFRSEDFKGFEGLKKMEGLDKLKELHKIVPDGGNVWKWEGPGGAENFYYSFGSHRRIGVSTVQLTKQLADYFGIADGKGVLVSSVTDDGPAAKAGIRAGDVITGIDGDKVESAGDLSRGINKKKDGEITLTIIRNKDQKRITLTPKVADTTITPGSIQRAGRTIVIPRVELGSLPEVSVHVPAITLPSVRPVSVMVPGKAFKPRVIRSGVNQPI